MSDYTIENGNKKKKPYYKNNKYKNKYHHRQGAEGEDKLSAAEGSTPANSKEKEIKEKNTPKSLEKTEKATDKGMEKAADKTNEKKSDKANDKTAEKNSEKSSDKSIEKSFDKINSQRNKKHQKGDASDKKDQSQKGAKAQGEPKDQKEAKDDPAEGKEIKHQPSKKAKKHSHEKEQRETREPKEAKEQPLKERAKEDEIFKASLPSSKNDNDKFPSYFSQMSEGAHEYVPDKNAEGFSKDPPFTDFSTAFDPVADFIKDKEANKMDEAPENDLCEMKTVIGIRFRTTTKTYYFDPMGIEYVDNSFAVVETSRGIEFGYVIMGNREVPVAKTFLPLRPALRPATKADKEHYQENRQKEAEAFSIWAEKTAFHGLEMKLIDVEYTFDNTKLLFYFTSEGRVDFRELVKDLASVFHCRIELRQMGIRDEAKVLGGLGVCGRAFCCGTFLPDFAQVSIKMAKEQSISLNSSKISGACGRLMCCLRYEHETYLEAIQRTPSVDWRVKTPLGTGVVVETKPLAGLIKVKLDSNPDAAPAVCLAEEAEVLGRDKSKDKSPAEDEDLSDIILD